MRWLVAAEPESDTEHPGQREIAAPASSSARGTHAARQRNVFGQWRSMPSLLCGVELRATDGGDAARCEAGGPSPSILEARSVSRPPELREFILERVKSILVDLRREHCGACKRHLCLELVA